VREDLRGPGFPERKYGHGRCRSWSPILPGIAGVSHLPDSGGPEHVVMASRVPEPDCRHETTMQGLC